jgi:hypothetical protein
MGDDIHTFSPGEEGDYERWVRRNDGYVLTERWEDAAGYMLHEATCPHLAIGKSPGFRFSGPRRCSRLSRPLRNWAKEQTGAEPLRCQTCFD